MCVSPRPGPSGWGQVAPRCNPALRGTGLFSMFPAAGVSDRLNRGTGRLPPPSQLCDVEGVAGGHVGRHLRLEAVDVAAVAEQVALQRVAAVALFIV